MRSHTAGVPAAPEAVGARRPRPKGRILLVDDNTGFSAMVAAHLEKAGYAAATAGDGVSGLAAVRRLKPDVVVLDIMMPEMDGLEVLKALRRESAVPVLFLTGRHGDMSQVLGFKLGADDYVTKPVCAEALSARIEAILRRRSAPAEADGPQVRQLGSAELDPERREVRVGGRPADLTNKEFDVLKALIDARGEVLSREELLNRVWGAGVDVELLARTVDQHIARIRAKLGPEGARVLTVPRFGYRLRLG